MRNLIFLLLVSFSLSCTSRAPSRQVDAVAPDPDYVAAVTEAPDPTGGNPVLTVLTWNVKHLGRKLFDPRQATPILAQADVMTFQEVNKKDDGQKALMMMADQLEKLTGEKICIALTDVPTGEDRERYGYLWKNSRVAFVKTDGKVINDCPRSALMFRLGIKSAEHIRREPAFGTFFFKPTAKQFVLASIHLVPEKKNPGLEVAPLFQSFTAVTHPLIVAGDFNLKSTDPSFNVARAMDFTATLPPGTKTSMKRDKRELFKEYDNLWIRQLKLSQPAQVINLYSVFPEKTQKEIYKNFSDHSPVLAFYTFQ